MSRGWKRQLTEEAEDERADFDRELGDGGCTCFISPPCSWCLHPGNPNNQENDDSAWELVSPGRQAQIERMRKHIERTIRAFIGARFTAEMAQIINRCAKFGPRFGWGRTTRKRAKMDLRGTYKRRDQWRLDKSAQRVREAAQRLAESVAAHIGNPCTADDFLGAFERREGGMVVFGTPMTDQAASKFKQAWEEAMRKGPPAQPIICTEPPRYISMSVEIGGQE